MVILQYSSYSLALYIVWQLSVIFIILKLIESFLDGFDGITLPDSERRM